MEFKELLGGGGAVEVGLHLLLLLKIFFIELPHGLLVVLHIAVDPRVLMCLSCHVC